jgi:outer membrane protein assembly factor BamB
MVLSSESNVTACERCMDRKPISGAAASDKPTESRLRLWPLAVVAIGAAIALLLIWRADLTRSWAIIYTGQTILLSLVLFLAWLLLLSGLRRRTRLISFVAIVAPLALLVALLKIDHVSGDLIPALRWRFSPKPYQRLAVHVAAETSNAGDGGIELSSVAERNWPQFLGPRRDGMLPDVRLNSDWQSHPPKLLWRQPIGAGWSSFAVVGQYCLTQEQRGPQELVTCYELQSGKLVWAHVSESLFESKIAGDGPRGTPTIDQGQVFAMGANALLTAVDGRTGKPLWPSRDVLKDSSPTVQPWGPACSPLVVDDLVIVTGGAEIGPSLVAYDRQSGQLVWKADDQHKSNETYDSPMLADLCGQRQVLIFNDDVISGFDPATGKRLWHSPWYGEESKATQPLVLPGDRLLLASGYGVGAALLQLSRGNDGQIVATEVWQNRKLKPKFSNLVHREDYVYGLDEGILTCLEIDSGQQQWKKGRYGHGQILLVGDKILIQAEQGEIVLVEASPKGHRELSRFPALEGKTWNHPVLVPPYLLVRNDQQAACYELALDAPLSEQSVVAE